MTRRQPSEPTNDPGSVTNPVVRVWSHAGSSVSSTAGANTSLVFGLQGLRLFVMVLAAPVLVRWLLRRNARRAG